jgi:ATP-dependent helicase HrpB
LAEHIAGDFARYIKIETSLLDRIALAAKVLPEESWPAIDLVAMLPEMSAGKRTIDEVARAGWSDAILARLSWQQRKILDDEIPAKITVPTGNAINVDYSGEKPALAVRLQELFGLAETPRIAKGRVAVVLQLLSPGYKPVQVTTDLASFWSTTYAEVKKELRARYPRHSWPDDPWTATPTSRAKKRGT